MKARTMNAQNSAMRETSADFGSLEQPSPSQPTLPNPYEQPTEHGCLYTRWDGIRVYVTESHDVAKHFLCWGWPLHPRYNEDWCRRTGTYIFVALSKTRVLKAEAVAALPAADYKRWERTVMAEGESADLRAAKRRGRKQLHKSLKHAQMRLDEHYHYANEVNAKRGMGWELVNLQDWKLRWPTTVAEGSIEMSDERFSDYVKSGNVFGYKWSGKPVNDWYWYQQMPRLTPRSGKHNYDGNKRLNDGVSDIPPDAIPLWYNVDGDSNSTRAIEGAVDAAPIFPALVQAYVTGDGKNVRSTRVGRVEKMLAFIRYVYGPRAAIAGEAYLLAHCPEYTRCTRDTADRLLHEGDDDAALAAA